MEGGWPCRTSASEGLHLPPTRAPPTPPTPPPVRAQTYISVRNLALAAAPSPAQRPLLAFLYYLPAYPDYGIPRPSYQISNAAYKAQLARERRRHQGGSGAGRGWPKNGCCRPGVANLRRK
jgi:hypothetical protein